MHPDLSPHLHTEECNNLIKELQQCHEQNTFSKFIGACDVVNSKLLRCLKNERLERRRQNIIKAKLQLEKTQLEFQKS